MKRGEIWWADIPPPYHRRPVIILTRDEVLSTIGSIVASVITTTVRDLPTEVALGRAQGLQKYCVANLDNLLTLPRHRFKHLMGACGKEKLLEIERAVKFALEIS